MATFKRFASTDIVLGNPTTVTEGLWAGDTGSLTLFFTLGSQTTGSTSGQYYWNVYNINPTSSDALIQFAVAYGHRTGGGNQSLTVNNLATLSTEATYLQYRNILLDPGDSQFTFLGNYNSDHIYVINIERAQLKVQLDPGNWELFLSGTNGIFTFIDDSGQTLSPTLGKTGQIFNVVSGSLTGASGSTIATSQSATKGGFGLVYPELGIIILSPDAIAATIGMVSGGFAVSSSAPFAPNTGTITTEYNQAGIFNAIRLGGDFQARSSQTISSTHYFVRLQNQEFCYSNNPTFYNNSNGAIINTDFIQDPRVYPTTIGLYNDNNELLAVAKLSGPVQKSFASELLARVRLDF